MDIFDEMIQKYYFCIHFRCFAECFFHNYEGAVVLWRKGNGIGIQLLCAAVGCRVDKTHIIILVCRKKRR